jgi:putative ABC transport system permease protein
MDRPNARKDTRTTFRRAYRALLRLLPFEFRAEFGRDMEQAFCDEREDVRERGRVRETLAFWFRVARDFARTAPQQHWDVLRQDGRVGLRLLIRNRGFAAAAILTLALGIGGSTSIFSVVYAVVLRPLAFPESERVVRIGWARDGETTRGVSGISFGNLLALREKCRSFDLIGAVRYDSLSSDKGSLLVALPHSGAIGVGQPFVSPQMASASFFGVFGASTVIGRLPDARDEQPGSTPVAVISHGTWTSLYGRSPDVIGRTLVRHFGDGVKKTVTIVGVLAPGAFEYPYPSSGQVTAWGVLDPDAMRRRDDDGREILSLGAYARLAPGITLEAAQAEITALTPRLAAGLPDHLASPKTTLQAVLLRDQIVGSVRTPLLAFLGAVACLLLVASVNVASLVLARAISRGPEFAARFALGARPLRVARQLLTESAILAVCGGLFGLALAWVARRAFVAVSPSMPRLDESGIGTPALVFALLAVLLATCITGLVPALQSSRRSVVDGLRRAGGASATATVFSRPLAVLAAVEVALVLVLLAGTGLLVNSFARLILFDLGFDARSTIVTMIERNIEPDGSSPPAKRTEAAQTVATLSARQQQMRAVDNEIMQLVSGIFGISSAGLAGDVPFGPSYRAAVNIKIGDAPAAVPLRIASPEALDALGMRMVDGRWFSTADGDGTPFVAVVNEAMARRLWEGRRPVGDRIAYGRRSLQVVGIVADVRYRGAREDARPTLYVSSTQISPEPVMLVVRPRPGVTGMERTLAAELSRMGNRIKPGGPRRLEDLWWKQLADARFLTLVLSVFSVLALAVALVGVHGVLRFLVAQRTREMGIRKALGATRLDLVALVLGQAMRFALPGCLVGLVAAAAAGPALGSLLFGVTPADPLTLLAATVLLIAAVLVGAYLPARRASAIDPALSLRAE